jgi:flagellar biosynthetic protein FliR
MTSVVQIVLPQFQSLLVIAARVGGILAAMPLLGSRKVPPHIKAGLVLVLSLVLLPVVRVPGLPGDPLAMTVGLGAEFLVGLVLGLALRILFVGVEIAGELMDHQMGIGMAQLFDPTASHQISLISHFQTVVVSMIFLSLNLHFAVVAAVASSFDLVAPFGASLSANLAADIVRMFGGAFVIALKLAAPLTAALLLVNLGLAVLGRAVPQMNVFMLGFPITIGGGLLALGMALPYMAGLYESVLAGIGEEIDDLLRMLGHG